MIISRDELFAKHHRPPGENENSKASPKGNAPAELVVVEMRFMIVFLGLVKTEYRFLFASCMNCFFNCFKLLASTDLVMTSFVAEKDGHLDR